MKCVRGLAPFLFLCLLCGSLLVMSLRAADGDESAPSVQARARQLASDVREFAREPGLSRAKREKRIATAVRVAVVAATAYHREPDEIAGAAAELASAATRAAPAYADVIINAASFAPAVAHLDGAGSQIRSAALAAARGGRTKVASRQENEEETDAPRHRASHTVRNEQAAPPSDQDEETSPPPRRARRPAPVVADDTAMASEAPAPSGYDDRPTKRVDLGTGARVAVTTDLSVRHDDNVYLANSNKVGDTIISATPGLDFHWGQDALTHGSLVYQETFERYTGKTAPNVALGNGSANFGYDDGDTSANSAATYQQTYQANTDLLATGHSELVRTNIFGASGAFGTTIGAKTGFRLGAAYTDTQYRTDGLIGNSYLSFPVSVFYKTTPKTDISLGYTFSSQRPDDGGPRSHDNYFNVGANGEFTAKLSGNISVGVQNRRVGSNPSDRMLAFNGGLNYALTPKTTANLTLRREFNASALGATTKNAAYRLGLNTEVSPQWRLGANVGYLDNDYGAGVFRTDSGSSLFQRTDRTWEANFIATYLYSDWLSTSASYALRNNRSTLAGVDFSDNVLNLTVGLRY